MTLPARLYHMAQIILWMWPCDQGLDFYESLVRWLGVRLRAKWLWVRIPLLLLGCRASFRRGVAGCSGGYGVQIRYGARAWHDNGM